MDAIILREPLEKVNALVYHAIPGLSLFIGKRSIAVNAPLLEQCCAAIATAEIRAEGLFETAAKAHSRACFLFAPTIEIAETISELTANVPLQTLDQDIDPLANQGIG